MKHLLPLLLILCLLVIISCGTSEKKQAIQSSDDSSKTVVDSTKYPEKPEGYKSPHQEQSEKHKDEPSRIK